MSYKGIKRNMSVFVIHNNEIREGLINQILLDLNSHKVVVQLLNKTDINFKPVYLIVPITEVFVDMISALSWKRTWHLKEADRLKNEIAKELDK